MDRTTLRRKQRLLKNYGHLSQNLKLSEFALGLEINTPKSEIWFYNLYKKSPNDKFNCPFGPYIPDVINHFFKYVIEIDGSIHDRNDIKAKDKIKENFYRSKGYEVYRIKAFNLASFNEAMEKLSRA